MLACWQANSATSGLREVSRDKRTGAPRQRAYPGAAPKLFGAFARRVEKTHDFAAAFSAAQASSLPALIELRTDPRQITPAQRLNT